MQITKINACVFSLPASFVGLDRVWRWAMQFRAEFAPKLSMADVVAFLGLQALEISARIASEFHCYSKLVLNSSFLPVLQFFQPDDHLTTKGKVPPTFLMDFNFYDHA